MKLSIGQAWEEARGSLVRDGGLYLTVALAFSVLPSVLFGLVMPVPRQDAGAGVSLLMLGVILSGLLSQIALQRLALLPGLSVAQALRGALLPTVWFFLAVLLVAIPLTFLLAPFVPAIQSGNPVQAGPAATAIMLILLVALFPISRFVLAMPIAGVTGARTLTQLKRSWQLTRGNNLRLYGLALLFLILLGLVIQLANLSVGSVVTLLLGKPAPWSLAALLLGLAVQLAQLLIVLPFSLIVARLYAQATRPAATPSVPSAGDH